jgi:DNA invertase Pin-like site-specific DNA recombinase
MLNPKIADHHLTRNACIYIRQSTMAQVRFNQESTERQYNLADQAKSLGWMPEQIRILDGDLAQSGQLTTKRDDFKTLVSDVAMGQVGAIFSRSLRAWHARTRTGIDYWNCAPSPRHWYSTEMAATIRPTSTTALSSA